MPGVIAALAGWPPARSIVRTATVPAPYVLAGAGCVAAAATVLLVGGLSPSRPSAAVIHLALPLLMAMLGVSDAGADQRHGTLHLEVVAARSRWRQWREASLGVVVVGALSGAAAGVVGAVAVAVAFDPFPRPLVAVGAAAVVAAAWALIGASVTRTVHSSLGAASAVLLYLVVVEPIVETATPAAAPWLPSRAAADLLDASGGTAALGSPALHLVAVAVVCSVTAALVGSRRSIGVTQE